MSIPVFVYSILILLGARQGVHGSCSRALQAMRSIRQRLGSGITSSNIASEQRGNFAPYGKGA